MKNFTYYIIRWFLHLISIFYSIIGIKKNYIIFSTYDNQHYSDNSRYLYEFFSKKKLNVFWITNNDKVKSYLDSKNLNHIGATNLFKLINVSLKTKLIFSSGSDYFNCYGFLKKKNVIKIHLGHGAGNKVVIQKYIGTNQYEDYSKFNLINLTSGYTIKNIGIKNYKLKKNKFINFGYPRVENLFNNKNSNNKNFLITILGNYENEKIILYTPTWRPYLYNFPLYKLKNFDLNKFNKFLRKNNIIFCISFHPLGPRDIHKFENSNFSNIRLINKKLYPYFDTTYFLNFVDILLNDCSTTSTEFAFLKKPQIFVFPDYKKYIKHTSFLENYKTDLPGNLIVNFDDLKTEILNNIKDTKIYKKKFAKQLKNNLKKYYDHKINKKVNEKFYKFVLKIID